MSDQKVECIVKFGGRAVTFKEQFETANVDAILAAAKIFASSRTDEGMVAPTEKFIVVHGAGSYGHFQAKEYGVADGYAKGKSLAEIKEIQMGLCKTRLSVTKLNSIIVSAFIQQGIPAVGVSSFNSWITDKKETAIVSDMIQVLSRSLSDGYLPIIHGDAVLDLSHGCCILGGDAIVEVLCKYFQPKRVLFLTDVDGIYDQPPTQQGANHIPQINVHQNGSIATRLSTTVSNHDVTGGIMGKLTSACRIVKQSKGETRVFIGRLGSPIAKDVVRDEGKLENGLAAGLWTEICYDQCQT